MSDLYTEIVENSVNEIYVLHSSTFAVRYANLALRTNLGFNSEALLKLKPWNFVKWFEADNFEQLLSPLKTREVGKLTFESEHKRSDGTRYAISAQLTYLPSQSPPVYVAIVQDITERKQYESIVRLRDRAMDAVDVGVTITDASKSDHPLVYVNKTICSMTGYDADELLGQGVRILQKNNRSQPEHQKIRDAQANAEPVQVLFESTRRDGTNYMDELSLSPIFNSAGELTHYIGINRDITEKHEMEKRLHHSQKIDAIGQLSGGIAHDFNNMLSVVSGNLEFLAMEISDKSQLEFIDEAQSAAQMSARLTRRLLSFAKQGLLEPATISLNQYVMEALALLRSTIGENISLSSNLAPDLWNTLADPSEIENTVVNLAINARDAMPEGGEITITTKNSQIDDELLIEIGIHPGQYVQLSVADNGVGMSEEVQEHIFEPFYTTKEPGKGTGLGLASIYGFARQSGGTVTVYSEIGHGTVINVYLPRHVKEHDEKSASKPVELAASEKKLRVLVVEDNEMVRKVTVKRMQALGYSTVQVDDGTEAIKTLERDSDFDLVFSDIVMPGGVSGYDVAHWVSAHIPQCAVLLTSGFNEQFVASNGSKTDEIAVLQKPYNLVELQQAIMALDKV